MSGASPELTILGIAMKDQVEADKLLPIFNKVQSTDRGLLNIGEAITEFYKQYPNNKSVDTQTLKDFYKTKWKFRKGLQDVLETIDLIGGVDISSNSSKIFVEQLYERNMASTISQLITPVLEGSTFGTTETLKEIITKFEKLIGKDKCDRDRFLPFDPTVDEILQEHNSNKDVDWPIKILNVCVGAPQRQTYTLIGGYVGSGKTSFTVNTTCKFATHLLHKFPDDPTMCVLYLSNEENPFKIHDRLICSTLNITHDEYKQNVAKHKAAYKDKAGQRVHLFEHVFSHARVVELVREFKPRITVLDQSAKAVVQAAAKLEGVASLEKTFATQRLMAQEENTALIGVHQTKLEGKNNWFLGRECLHGSNVDIAANLDTQIMLGYKGDSDEENKRGLNIAKAKGKSGRQMILFDRNRCRYTDYGQPEVNN